MAAPPRASSLVAENVGRMPPSSRLEAFSDMIFAFAATLLVVSLDVPKSISELAADLSGFLGFAASFGALILIWTVHHAYFRRYSLEDAWTIALDSLLLLGPLCACHGIWSEKRKPTS